jgi:phosphohistidine phosphatase
MKSVYIMRHAKSGLGHSGMDDFDRTLSPAGRQEAMLVGRHLAAEEAKPGYALVSSALRTRQTWEAVSVVAGYGFKPEFSKEFYNAPERTWLSAIRELPDEISSVLLIGHHPGVDSLALSLSSRGGPDALARMSGGFSTGALAHLSFDLDWKDIQPGAGLLISFVESRQL